MAAHDLIVVSVGPVETTGEFPLYFPELVQPIDKTLRTIPDRDHRGVTGVALGGFVALGPPAIPRPRGQRASSNPFPEAAVGPADFPPIAAWRTARTTTTASAPFHWRPTPGRCSPFTPGCSQSPFLNPAVFSHADVYPNFVVWGWEAARTGASPGFTVLENVSEGFSFHRARVGSRGRRLRT